MDPVVIGLLGLIILFVMLLIGVPIGVVFLAVGFFGIAAVSGWPAAKSTMAIEMWGISSEYQLIVIPLFVVMGNFANVSGLGRDLYDAAHAWIGHIRGGLASTTIVAQAGFAALSGSSLASAVTMGRVALPEMKRFKYDDRLATGCVAAGGTLGFLIPPSAGMVIYAYLTDQNIAALFLAGVLPGIMLALLFVLAIAIITKINPELGPKAAVEQQFAIWRVLSRLSTMLLVLLMTIVSILAALTASRFEVVLTTTSAVIYGALTFVLLASVAALLRRSAGIGVLVSLAIIAAGALFVFFESAMSAAAISRLAFYAFGSYAVWLYVVRNDSIRMQTLWRARTIIAVILVTIGGMYLGFFTPVEASGFGALLTALVTVARRKFTIPITKSVVLQTVRTTATLFLILIGARVFAPFMARTGLPELVVDVLLSVDVGTVGILIILLATYMILGTFMEGFSMLVLTLPVVLPVLRELDVSLIWFGVASVIVIEMGLISPPLGINVFVVKGLVPNVPLGTIFRGIWPFWFAMAIGVGILIAFPDIALYMPNTMR